MESIYYGNMPIFMELQMVFKPSKFEGADTVMKRFPYENIAALIPTRSVRISKSSFERLCYWRMGGDLAFEPIRKYRFRK